MTTVHVSVRTTPSSDEPLAVFTDSIGGSGKPPLIYCHQHATSVAYMISDTTGVSYRELFSALSEDFTVFVAQLGYVPSPSQDTWGGPTWQTRLSEIVALGGSVYGTSAKVTLVGASMGGGGALNYAKANPTTVASVALAVPMISVNDLRNYNSGQYATAINAAFGGTYSNVTHGPTYSPEIYGSAYPDGTVPTAFWTASNDNVTLPTYSNNFVTQNPSVRNTDLGSLGHTEAAIFAASEGITDWVRTFKP